MDEIVQSASLRAETEFRGLGGAALSFGRNHLFLSSLRHLLACTNKLELEMQPVLLGNLSIQDS